MLIFSSHPMPLVPFILAMLLKVTTCQESLSDLLMSYIVSRTAADGQHPPQQQMPDSVQLDLDKVRELQQWIGQMVDQFVVEDGTFAGIYKCHQQQDIDQKISEIIALISDLPQELAQNGRQFLTILFSFGALLSAEIGGPTVVESSNHLRSLIMAYQCVGGELKQAGKSADKKSVWSKLWNNETKSLLNDTDHSIPTFAITPFVKRNAPIEKLEVANIRIENAKNETQQNHQRNIEKFVLLNALSSAELSPIDVMELTYLLYNEKNPFNKELLEESGLTVQTFENDQANWRRIDRILLLHWLNWGPKKLKRHFDDSPLYLHGIPKRVKCAKIIFANNLLQRLLISGLLADCFSTLGMADQIEVIKQRQSLFEYVAEKRCKEMQAEGEEKEENGTSQAAEALLNANVYANYDKAIRIDWNIYKDAVRRANFVIGTIGRIQEMPKQLMAFLKGDEFQQSVGIISAKFDEANKLKGEVQQKTITVDEFCSKLAPIISKCHGKIEPYEREMPFKINLYYKKRAFSIKSFDLLELFMRDFGGRLVKRDSGRDELIFGFNWAHQMLEQVNKLALNSILKSAKNHQFECREKAELEKINFMGAINKLLSGAKGTLMKQLNGRALGGMKNKKFEKNTDQILTGENAKIIQHLVEELNQLQVVQMPPKIDDNKIEQKMASEIDAHLFHLLFSFAARLEAIVQGKSEEDGTIQPIGPNSKDRMQAFLAVPKCLPVQEEWHNELSIFDCHMGSETYEYRIEVHRRVWENDEAEQKWAKGTAKSTFQILKALNAQPFSIFETTKLLEKIYQQISSNYYFKEYPIEGKMPEIFVKLVQQIMLQFNVINNAGINNLDFYWIEKVFPNDSIKLFGACELLRLQQYIRPILLRMLKENGIESTKYEKHFKLGEFQDKIEEQCAKLEHIKWHEKSKVEAPNSSLVLEGSTKHIKSVLSNTVRYELAMNFEFNAWKDIYDRLEDFLIHWKGIFSDEKIFDDIQQIDAKLNEFVKDTFEELMPDIDAFKKGISSEFGLGSVTELKSLIEALASQKMELEKAKQEKKRTGKLEKGIKQKMGEAKALAMNAIEMFEERKEIFGKKMRRDTAPTDTE